MKKGVIIILAAVLIVGLGLGGLALTNNMKSTKQFLADGYIIDPSDDETITSDNDAQYYFAQGDKYKEKYGDTIMFKDTSGNKSALDTTHFIHYNEGSLGSFTKGVIMDISNIKDESTYGYYSLTKNTVLTKNGNSYEMTSRGEPMELTELIWKISDTDYMLVSPSITLHIGTEDVTFEDYAQLTYVDSGIVRISHQTGSYQTVASDSTLVTEQGAELNLVGKSFMVDGEPVFSLDDMAIDDDSYIDIDENVEDAPTIPTFNVINGKDGVSGTDGTDGEEGEQGEEGKEGEEGAEGTIGEEGTIGTEGSIGEDGVEGDTGVMGYDGKKGEMGVDAETAGSASELSAVDLNARPTITMNPLTSGSDDTFNVTANSATFSLKLDGFQDVGAQGETKIELYDRDTMELVDTRSNLSGLESGQVSTIDFSGLTADKEYVMVVKGKYQVDPNDPSSMIESDYFRKVFKTESAGIFLEKKEVTDTSISTSAVVTGTVSTYDVVYYYMNGDTEENIAIFHYQASGNDSLVDDTHPEANTAGVDRNNQFFVGSDPIKSNTTYYAKLANVVSGGSTVNVEGSEVELRTLKQTPYEKESNPKKYINEMDTTLEKSEKNHSLTVKINDITDPDIGILGYKYELYKESDITNASDISAVTPVYTDESTELKAKTFVLPDSDQNRYVGRVVVTFNDNEKTREIATKLSSANELPEADNSLSVVFQNVNPERGHMDRISGDIVITDNSANQKLLLGNVSQTNPLILTITGEYDEVINIKLNSVAVGSTGTTTYKITQSNSTQIDGASATVADVSGNVVTIHFAVDGLRKKTLYSVSLRGPEDTDGDGSIVTTEAETYLAGIRTETAKDSPLGMAGFSLNRATSAFTYGINLTSATTDTSDMAAAEYETNIMEELSLELIHVAEGGASRVIGTTKVMKDLNPLIQDSTFHEKTYLARDNSGIIVGTDNSLTIDSSNANYDASTYPESYVLTPASFGLDDQDNVFYSGGSFQIRVKSATDYTSHKNEIPFVDGQDVINFTVTEKHVQAADPNTQVDVTLLPNSAAPQDQKEEGISDDTIVGMRFEAEYAYDDIGKIVYTIYEVDEGSTNASTADIDGDGTHPSRFIYGANSEIYSGEKIPENKISKDLQLVPKLQVSKMSDAGNRSTMPIELYFKKTECTSPASGVAIKKYDSSGSLADLGTDGETVLERGKRYIIIYEVESPTSHEPGGYTCLNTSQAYPYCTYEGGQAGGKTPFYRSSVIELNRQMPVVERYPYSSEDSKDTWSYRFIDPDNALISNTSNQVAAKVGKATAYATSKTDKSGNVDITLPPADTGFVNVDVEVAANYYYTVQLPYRLLDSDRTGSYMVSEPVKKLATSTLDTAQAKIRLQGNPVADGNTTIPEEDRITIGGKVYEKAIINEGNYRFRINLRGKDLNKVAALRVTMTDTANSDNTIVYDPVYLAYVNDITEESTTEKYGYAYLDASPLTIIWEEKTVSVDVKAYYSTQNSGFGAITNDGYKSTRDDFNNMTLDGENLYAIRRYNPSDENDVSTYRKLVDNNWAISDAKGSAKDSVFVPGAAKGAGLMVTSVSGQPSTVTMSQRYMKDAIVTYEDLDTMFQSKTETMYLDETGLHSGTDYYTVEKLGITGSVGYKDQNDNEVTIGEIMPAIQSSRISVGATSAYMKMDLVGSAANSDSNIYATLAMVDGTNIKYIKLGQETISETGEKYYKVEKDTDGSPVETLAPTVSGSDYAYATFNDNNIPISADGKNLELTIRGLSLSTKYQVIFFTYDAGHNYKPLYSIDGGRVGYPYELRTLNEVQLEIPEPSLILNTYTDKKYSFGAAVSGSDGVNIAIKYTVKKSNGDIIVGPTLLEPLGSGGYRYYSQDPANNNHFELNINPRGGQLNNNTKYKIILEAYDASAGLNDASLGERIGTREREFTTYSTKSDPSFYITTSTTENSITAKIQCFDDGRTLMDESNRGVGRYMVSLFDKDGSPVLINGSDNVYSYVVDLEHMTEDSVDSQTNQMTWTNLNSVDYRVEVNADVDNDNDGVSNKTLAPYLDVAISGMARATFGASATASQVIINATNTSNFKDVTKIVFTAFNESGTQVDTWTEDKSADGGFVTDDPGSFNVSHSWTNSLSSGNYSIQMRFMKGDTPAGNYETMVTIN